jgi:hypothetical protein
MIDLPPPEVVAWCRAVVAAADALRQDDDAAPTADGWVSEREAAEAAGITVHQLRGHRRRETGPPFRPHRGRVLYRREQVIAWAAVKLSRKGGREAIDGDASGN